MSLLFITIVITLISSFNSNKLFFDNEYKSQVCSGMYSKDDWGGKQDSYINLELTNFELSELDLDKNDLRNRVYFFIFEYKDFSDIGFQLDNGERKYFCDEYAIETLKICDKSQLNKLLFNKKKDSSIFYDNLISVGPTNIKYDVKKTGYYCVYTFSILNLKYNGFINFQNSFGELNASEIPKLPAYGFLSLFYLILLSLFGFRFYVKKKDNQILPLQKYLLVILSFLSFDCLCIWLFYKIKNHMKNNQSIIIKIFVIFLSLLNSAKISVSFFLLLCISLGYGIITPKLTKTQMFRCKLLAFSHLFASLLYLMPNYYENLLKKTNRINKKNNDSFWSIITVIPIFIILLIYYASILISIKKTTSKLHQQRQVIKLKLYENLFKLIFLLVFLTFLGLLLSSVIFLNMSTSDAVEEHWKGSYFIFDFWPSMVYFFVFMGLCWLLRPTETSYMLAVSQQISNYDDEFTNKFYKNEKDFELDNISFFDVENIKEQDVKSLNNFDSKDQDNNATFKSQESNSNVFKLDDNYDSSKTNDD